MDFYHHQNHQNKGFDKIAQKWTEASQNETFFKNQGNQVINQEAETIQISFEDNFMTQHRESLSRKIKSLMEVLVQKKNYSECSMFFETTTTISIESVLASSENNINSSKAKQFMKWLQEKAKLKQFLQIILKTYPSEISYGLITVAYQLWNLNLRLHELKLDSDDLLKAGVKISSESFIMLACQRINLFKTEEKSQKQIEEVKNFITYFVVTCLFVSEQYFFNPFYEEREDEFQIESARHFSLGSNSHRSLMDFSEQEDDNDNLEGLGSSRKKRKYF